MTSSDPWDKPVPIPDSGAAVSRQLMPKCPLPPVMTRRSSRVRDGDAMATQKWHNSTDTKGSASPTSKSQAMTKNFRQSEDPVPNNARRASLSPMETNKPRRRHSSSLYPRLPPSNNSVDSKDNGDMSTSKGNDTNSNTNSNSKDEAAIAAVSTAKSFNSAKLMAEAHRRQRNKRWEQQKTRSSSFRKNPDAEEADGGVRTMANANFSSRAVQQCLQDQQRRSIDSIPHHVDVGDKSGSNCGGADYVDDDEITMYSRASVAPPSFGPSTSGYWAPPLEEKEEEASKGPQEHYSKSHNMGSSVCSTPSFLDKSYLKNLAAQHRSTVNASLASRGGSAGDHHTGSRSSKPLVTPPESPSGTYQYRRREPVSSQRSPPRYQHQQAVSRPPQQHKSPPRTRDVVPPPPSPPQPQQQQEEPLMVEICPGLSAPLRGSDEIRKAVAKKFYATNLLCFGCAQEICCIADVQYTMCPHCRVISPVEDNTFDGEKLSYRWGLGLGFTKESLWDIQAELAAASMY